MRCAMAVATIENVGTLSNLLDKDDAGRSGRPGRWNGTKLRRGLQ